MKLLLIATILMLTGCAPIQPLKVPEPYHPLDGIELWYWVEDDSMEVRVGE